MGQPQFRNFELLSLRPSDTLRACRIPVHSVFRKTSPAQTTVLDQGDCIRVVESPKRVELQERDRDRFWGSVDELEGRFSRGVTLSDKLTITTRSWIADSAHEINYFPDTDSLYIDLSHRPSVESQEVSEGVVLDYDGEGNWSESTSTSQSASWIYASSSQTNSP